ncbi:MAG: hypothetical protein LQ343_005754 [Gyalolechia ehrenbergii]|nr:MAG: hypothetical protein LQ343_005754 [Gyalolechia ehrenbergii]
MQAPCRANFLPISQPLLRSFSTTTQSLARPSRSGLKHAHRNIPTYPHGPSLLYKKSNFGLYGGVKPQFGNKVSERNEIKTRRKWEPNIHEKRLWSAAMQKYVRVKVQARVLRTIDKVGGLDEYLLGESPGRIKELGMEGWRMRWRLMQLRSVKERLRRRRVQLGVSPEGPEMWLSDRELLGEEEEEGGEGKGKVKEVELRVKEEEGEGEDEYEGLNLNEEEIIREEEIARGEPRMPFLGQKTTVGPEAPAIFRRRPDASV